MAATRNAEREARDRLRRYTARRTVHAAAIARRRRDNTVGLITLLAIGVLATVSQVLFVTVGPGAPDPTASASPSASPDAANTGDVPAATIAEGRTWTGSMSLNDSPLEFTLDGAAAPQAASVFISLVQDGYYTGNECTRLTTGESIKVIQCGAPGGSSVDPGFTFGPIENAPADGAYPAGTIAMANAGTASSQSTQFFITWGDSTLDTTTGYTVIGTVTGGLDDFVSKVANAGVAPGTDGAASIDGAPLVPTTITAIDVR